jgi:hypothetical protein
MCGFCIAVRVFCNAETLAMVARRAVCTKQCRPLPGAPFRVLRCQRVTGQKQTVVTPICGSRAFFVEGFLSKCPVAFWSLSISCLRDKRARCECCANSRSSSKWDAYLTIIYSCSVVVVVCLGAKRVCVSVLGKLAGCSSYVSCASAVACKCHNRKCCAFLVLNLQAGKMFRFSFQMHRVRFLITQNTKAIFAMKSKKVCICALFFSHLCDNWIVKKSS